MAKVKIEVLIWLGRITSFCLDTKVTARLETFSMYPEGSDLELRVVCGIKAKVSEIFQLRAGNTTLSPFLQQPLCPFTLTAESN